tara:strand:+ start:2605 stop:2838 length:234 start_codon:yes stop_codon:yes gene_type:complete
MNPEKDNRGIKPTYLSSTAQKAYFLAAVWLLLAVNASALMVMTIRNGDYLAGAILAVVSIFLWTRVVWNVQTAMLFR